METADKAMLAMTTVGEPPRELASLLSAMDDTLRGLEEEAHALDARLAGIAYPDEEMKHAEEPRLIPETELGRMFDSMQQRIASVRNRLYSLNRRVQL